MRVGEASFYLSSADLEQVKSWINDRRQETAMRWWAANFDIPFARAVGVINRIQVSIQFGNGLDVADVSDKEALAVAEQVLKQTAPANRG